MNETGIKMQLDGLFLCTSEAQFSGRFLPVPHDIHHLSASQVAVPTWVVIIQTFDIELCKLSIKFFFSGRLCVFCLDSSLAVYYADIPFHAGLAGSHGVHLAASLHVLQPVDHLPKHHLSGGSESLPGPSSVW